jgi:hypothetical protein
MTDRELMQQALDALKVMRPACFAENTLKTADTAITALRDRLAQPEEEPFEYWNAVEGWVKIDEVREHFDSVGCGTIYKTAGEDRTPLYTTPPQRDWVGLTDEDRQELAAEQHSWDGLCFAVEKKLKDKNV